MPFPYIHPYDMAVLFERSKGAASVQVQHFSLQGIAGAHPGTVLMMDDSFKTLPQKALETGVVQHFQKTRVDILKPSVLNDDQKACG